MRIPAYSGDVELQTLFRHIDEQLSELYSLHGIKGFRGNPVLKDASTEAVKNNELRAQSVAKAWLYYDGSDHQIISSYNINKVVVAPGSGSYVVYLNTPVASEYPAAVGTAQTAASYFTISLTAYTSPSDNQTSVVVNTYDVVGGALADAYFYLVVYGD